MESIVFLDRQTLTVPLRAPSIPHQWVDYDMTMPLETAARLTEATVAVTNKVKITRDVLSAARHLRLVAVAATGFDCVDVAACRERGVTVCNVPGYSRDSVPEHVFLLLLALRRNLPALHRSVQSGAWQAAPHFALLEYPIDDIAGTTLGIIGYGALGRRVAEIAAAFRMKVLIAERQGAATIREGRAPFDEVLMHSDVVSIHAPLNAQTRGLIGVPELALMKRTAILINTARGGIVDERALVEALASGALAGAGVDVLTTEPPKSGNPLLDLQPPNLLVTPHVGWASRQAQTVLAEEIVKNIEALAGKPRNVVS